MIDSQLVKGKFLTKTKGTTQPEAANRDRGTSRATDEASKNQVAPIGTRTGPLSYEDQYQNPRGGGERGNR